MDYYDKDANREYYIMQRHGGPTIEFLSSLIFEKEDEIGTGFISIYPFYYRGNEELIPQQEFRDLYKLFVKFIKKMSVPMKISKRTYWVGKTAIMKAKSGELKLPPMIDVDNI